MWACRPFLRQPRALLSSSLSPIRRHVTGPPPALVAASRGLASGASDGDRRDDGTAKAKPTEAGAREGHRKGGAANSQPAVAHKHLYLVLHDSNGTNIHKMDIGDADEPDGDAEPGALPEPPMIRIEYQWINDFAVLGTNVIGMGPGLRQSQYDDRSDGDTLTFDTKTAALAVLPDLPEGVRDHGFTAAVPIGNRLYVIEGGSPIFSEYEDQFCMGGLHVATSPAAMAHALHPGGRAFFVSVCCRFVHDHRGHGTFSYDTKPGRAGARGWWTRHGDWELPFVGQALYDRGLDAWVGLHHVDYEPDGHLCSCAVPHLGQSGAPAPDWKVGKEKLFGEEPERRTEAKLVDMGGGGRFCLVEVLTPKEVDKAGCGSDNGKCADGGKRGGGGDEGLLRLTTFRVKFGDDGELTTTARQPARSYDLSKYGAHVRLKEAFWALHPINDRASPLI